MNGLNKVIIAGNLGSNPQSYPTATGKNYTALSIATERFIGRQEGGRSDKRTDWHYVRVWGKSAETCMRFLSKGQGVLIEGYLTQYSVDNPHEPGKKIRKTGITAQSVVFMPKSLKDQLPSMQVTEAAPDETEAELMHGSSYELPQELHS